jgi:CRISPR-associated exonuclease Cas4
VTLAAAILLILGLALVWRGGLLRRRTGLPWRRVVYQDTRRRELSRPLFSAEHRLTGQPDYVLEVGQALIPVEVKPTRRASQPRHGDVLQVAAYCLLVEEWSGTPPPYGLLRYAETTFEIRWDDDLCAELLETIELMRADLAEPEVDRSHNQAGRCQACGFADRCEQSLSS